MNHCSDSSHPAPKRHFFDLSMRPEKKSRINTLNTASVFIKPIGLPLVCKYTRSLCKSFHLEPHKPYTIGRDFFNCDFLFNDGRVSKTHCQILFDASSKKICLCDGLFFNFFDCVSSRDLRVSLNGVFVNGVRIGKGEVLGLRVGDEVLLVYGDEIFAKKRIRIGFIVERIVLVEDIAGGSVHKCREGGVCDNCLIGKSEGVEFDAKVGFLLSICREILCSNDPIKFIRKCSISHKENKFKCCRRNRNRKLSQILPSNIDLTLRCEDHIQGKECSTNTVLANSKELAADCHKEAALPSVKDTILKSSHGYGQTAQVVKNTSMQHLNDITENDKSEEGIMMKDESSSFGKHPQVQQKNNVGGMPAPGRKFYLNRLQFMDHGSLEYQNVVSLPELFCPITSLVRVFIATFTSDISWFLSHCEIPSNLPVTIACHNAERCWNSCPDKRTSIPYSDFPELVVVYPPFPEVIAFGNDRKRPGIGCHHPKLFVLQREDSLRVVITSANLVERQWLNVTNTVWWQDFPRLSVPDYLSLFLESPYEESNEDSKSDFSAQLAGFMASLLVDVPSQAHWILELSKYNFTGALAHLVTSVPGIHSPRSPYMSNSKYFLSVNQGLSKLPVAKLLGSIEASIVGLSYLFRTSADTNGAKLKKLASFLGKCHESVYGMSEVLLRRETNVPADANAISILLPKPEESAVVEDCVQLGFLPRNVAKWVAPLSDSGTFAFSAYVHPNEVLQAALEGSNNKVQLILYVSQGPSFSKISEAMTVDQVSAVCSLVGSIQRCVGLWRLQEVLSHYNWPEYLEKDFVFGSSSIGSVDARFLAAFAAAAGKKSVQSFESEESDPEWGCWSASQELRKPSIKIIYPTIERVKSASCGILASRYLLCFSQKTWQRLKCIGILHDAIPHPNNRIGFPMHVKVASRRFQNKEDPSFGWVYSGSHNFSAAAWGRPLSNVHDRNANLRNSSVLGSRLHVCNYELGIIFMVPPPGGEGCVDGKCKDLDDMPLPFVMPAPKYRPMDRPATPQAMREALVELAHLEESNAAVFNGEHLAEEVPDEEDEVLDTADFVAQEKEDEKAYAEKLWVQVDSSESC